MTKISEKCPTASQTHGRNVTKMVMVVVAVFLLSNTGNFIYEIYDYTKPKDTQSSIFITVADFALMLNPSVNIIIYAYFNRKFRKHFFDFFCSVCQNKNAGTDLALRRYRL